MFKQVLKNSLVLSGYKNYIIQLVIAMAKCQQAKISPIHMLFNLFVNVLNYRNLQKIARTQLHCLSKNYLENSELNCSNA